MEKKQRKRPKTYKKKLDSQHLQAKFLKALRETGHRVHSCRVTGICPVTLLRYEELHPDFAERAVDAQQEAHDKIEVTGKQLALAGDGPMIRFFLPHLFPEKYSNNYKIEHGGQLNIEAGVRVSVIEDENWYGNKAHDKAAQSAAASNSGVIEPGPPQGGGLRPALGEDGDGTDGDD